MEQKKTLRTLLILAVVFLLLWSVANLTSLTYVFNTLSSIFMPILAGLALAFILNLPLRLFERLWIKRFGAKRRGLRRGVCLLFCLLLIGGIIALILLAVLPQIIRTLGSLLESLPDYIDKIQGWWSFLSDFLVRHSFPFALPPLELDSERIGNAIGAYLEQHGHKLVDASVGFLLSTLSTVLNILVSCVIAIYVLAQKERLGASCKKLLAALFSEPTAGRILNFARLSERVFAKFITGQGTEAIIIGALCFVGMLLFRMPYALLISVLVSVTALIPIFGAFIGTGIGAFLILMVNPAQALWFVVFIVILQQLEGNLIYPRVVGKSVGLPSVWVLIAVIVGSSFGIVGMLISVPLASIAYCLLRQFADARLGRDT